MKKIALLLLVACTLLSFVACNLFKKDDEGGNDNGGSSTVDKDSYFWAEGVDFEVIFSADSSDMSPDVTDALYEATNTFPSYKSDSQAEGPHEIIIGKSSRDISVKAYQLLDREVESEEMAGYLIYSNGVSVAIAYSTIDVIDAALDECKVIGV